MSTIDVSTLGVIKVVTSTDVSDLYTDVSLNDGDIYTGDLRFPKQGLAFDNVKYYGSKTTFSSSGSNIVVNTDGDPYPSKSGASSGYINSTPTNEIVLRSWYDDPNPLTEQSSVYTFTYRGGTNTESSSVLYSSGGVSGIFSNGTAFLSPMGGQSLVTGMTTANNFYVNAYYFANFLGKDLLTGHPEETGQYHYHTGAFLYNGWNNSTFYNSNSYYSSTYYTLPTGNPSPYYNKTVFSDLSGTTGNSLYDHMRHADGHSKIVGFCFDGYPIYGPFGYTDSSGSSGGLKLMSSNYSLSSTAVSGRPYTYTESASLTQFISDTHGRHSYYNNASIYSRSNLIMGPGAYVNDWTYSSSNGGTLDTYNGKYTKTPDYPSGTYAYFLAVDTSGIPQYPYIVGNYSKQQRTFTETTNVYCTISSSRTTFSSGQTATITFTMNSSTTSFSSSRVTVSGGTLGTISGSGTTYTATFTPTANTTTSGSIIVSGTTGSTTFSSNTLSLSIATSTSTSVVCAISSSRTTFSSGQTATITFTMNSSTTSFSSSRVTVSGGTLGTISGSGTTYTATFTPTANTTTSGSIIVSGTTGSTTFSSNTLSLSIATSTSTSVVCAISSSRTTFSSGQTATITFTMNSSTTSFSSSRVTVTGGVLGTISGSGTTYTAKFTPTANTTTSGSIIVSGTTGSTTFSSNTLSLSIATSTSTSVVCAISSTRTTFTSSTNTATITFTMSASTTSFSSLRVTATGGTLGTISGSGKNYTATFTSTANTTTSGSIIVSGTTGSTTFSSNTLSLIISTTTTTTTSNVDVSNIAVSNIFVAGDYTDLYTDVSLNDGDIYTGDLRFPKQGAAFSNVKYYGSRTEFSIDGTNMVARSDGDPYPAKSGASSGYINSTPTNEVTTRSWYDDPNPLTEQSSVYTFTYRGGTNTESSSVLYSSGGVNGIFSNGIAFLSPMGGQSLVTGMTTANNFYVNAYYFANFLGKDLLTGHPEETGQYHYHTGAFLYNGWNNSTFYNSNSYYSSTYYTLPTGNPSPYYTKTVFSDLSGTTGNSLYDHMRHADGHSKIVGFCFDGYPIYGPFGYTDSSGASGGLKLMSSNYSLSSTAVSGRPYQYTGSVSLTTFITETSGRHSYYNNASIYSRSNLIMGPGAYVNDWTYSSSNGGTLDTYNGKYTKTPDYPSGTYAYFLAVDTSGIPQYPYIVGNYSKQQRTFTETTNVYCTISSSRTTFTSNNRTALITFTMNKSTTNFVSSDITVTGGAITGFTGSGTTYTATFTATANTITSGSIVVAAGIFTDTTNNKNYVSNTLTLAVNTSSSNVSNSPVQGASVFFVDSGGNMLAGSPTAITDSSGDFTFTSDISAFINDPLKVTGGTNIITGQTITYWYAPSGTKTMTPVTNLLFYCTENDSLTNRQILDSMGIRDSETDFLDYNYYKILATTSDTQTYSDALIANNLGNAINVFATIGAYFLHGMNSSNIDTEYDAMMRSIANISTNNNGNDEFSELFGTDKTACAKIITDRIKNKISNSIYTSTNYGTTGKTYAEVFASILADKMADIINAIMASTDVATTIDYEIIGYAVVEDVYTVMSGLSSSLGNPDSFTQSLTPIFTAAINTQLYNIKRLSVESLSIADKVYDGTKSATIVFYSFSGVESGHEVILTATFDDVNVGDNKTLTLKLSGRNYANYYLNNIASYVSACINPKNITINGISATDKEYNTTTDVTITGTPNLVGKIDGDIVSAVLSNASFASSDIGNHSVYTNYSLTGNSSANYILINPVIRGTITPKQLILTNNTLVPQNKIYDGTDHVIVSGSATLSNIYSSDICILSGYNNFIGANAGTQYVNIGLSGIHSYRYYILANLFSATIYQKEVTISYKHFIECDTKYYDGSSNITIKNALLGGVINRDNDQVSLGASCSDVSVGKNKRVTYILNDSTGNYYLTSPTDRVNGDLVVDIFANEIYYDPATVVATPKQYDCSDSVTVSTPTFTDKNNSITTLTGSTFVGKMVSSNAGSQKVIFSLSGSTTSNYILTAINSNPVYATVSPVELTVSGNIIASDKIYDGTTAASVSGMSLNGVLNGDSVGILSSSSYFSNKNIGVQTVNPIFTLTGVSRGNYTLMQRDLSSITAIISKATLSVGGNITVDEKTYDGNQTAYISGTELRGLATGDNVTLNVSGTYDTSSIGIDKPVTLVFSLSGYGLDNYTFSPPSTTGYVGNIIGTLPAPTNVTAITGVQSAFVSFTPPINGTVMYYIVTASTPGSEDAYTTGYNSTIAIHELENDSFYKFYVRAYDLSGNAGKLSSSSNGITTLSDSLIYATNYGRTYYVKGVKSNLVTVSIPRRYASRFVTYIGPGAFSNCTRLLSLNIPESITSIGTNAFDGCSALTSITVDSSNTNLYVTNKTIYNTGNTILYKHYGYTDTVFSIPNTVTTLNGGAFYGCSYIGQIILPANIDAIGSKTFYDCSSLEFAIFTTQLSAFSNPSDNSIFTGTNVSIIYYLKTATLNTDWSGNLFGLPTASVADLLNFTID